jgi:hypothetical protein
MSYPAKPVLVGKPVRCKGCRNAFVLQPEGHATKVEDPAPAPAAPKPPAPAVPPPAPKPAPAPQPQLVIDPITPAPPKPAVRAKSEAAIEVPSSAAVPVPTPAPAKPGTERQGRSARLTAQLLESRKQLSAQLAQVAAQAEQSEAVQQAEKKEKASERIAKPGTAKPATDRARRREAVLTGEGLAEHRNRIQWLIGTAVALAIVGVLYLVLSFDSAPRQALETYAQLPPAGETLYPRLGRVIRNRAWLVASQAQPNGPDLSTSLADASLGDQRRIDLGPVRERLAALKGLRLLPSGWWAEPAKAADVAALIDNRKPAEVLNLAKTRKLTLVHHPALLKELESAGLAGDDQALLLDLLTGTPSPDGVDFAVRMLDEADVPDAIILLSFAGEAGEFKIDNGHPPYRTATRAYAGVLARFEGAGWPTAWRVLRLAMHTD